MSKKGYCKDCAYSEALNDWRGGLNCNFQLPPWATPQTLRLVDYFQSCAFFEETS